MKHKAFTLTELLVVLVIIAILSMIVFPVIVNAKQTAKETASVRNVQNLFIATMLYRDDQNPKADIGHPWEQMGLPEPNAMVSILEKTSGLDERQQSPCGRHPRMDDDGGGYTTIYYMPMGPKQFAAHLAKHGGRTPLWVDANCSPPETPILLQYGAKQVAGVFFDGSTAKRRRSDRPFWDPQYYD